MISTSHLNRALPGCRNFYWYEALWLPSWGVHVLPPTDVYKKIINFAPKVQLVRDFLDIPMNVNSWYRPPEYNLAIGGASLSWHKKGGAIDFSCPRMSADSIRDILVPKLDDFGLRMEDLPGASWVHLDDKEPANKRFFKP